eukprot:UN16875
MITRVCIGDVAYLPTRSKIGADEGTDVHFGLMMYCVIRQRVGKTKENYGFCWLCRYGSV